MNKLKIFFKMAGFYNVMLLIIPLSIYVSYDIIYYKSSDWHLLLLLLPLLASALVVRYFTLEWRKFHGEEFTDGVFGKKIINK